MSLQYLLDTDTCIDLLRGEREVVRRASRVAPDDCAVSTVTTYELMTGARKCRAPDAERGKVEAFLGTIRELPFDPSAAARAAQVRADLETAGVPIGPYDVLLAGQALAAGLTLVTSNAAEFGRVKGLRTADWRRAPNSNP
jgi:tRNA(fMet)-specific endonuclease VapC